MTVWEKTLINLQNGYERVMSFAATFSERVKAEITIVRLKMQVHDIREKVREQHGVIGRKLLEMNDSGTLPGSFDLFFKNAEVVSALEKIGRAQKDLEIILDDLRHETEALKPAPSGKEEKSA